MCDPLEVVVTEEMLAAGEFALGRWVALEDGCCEAMNEMPHPESLKKLLTAVFRAMACSNSSLKINSYNDWLSFTA